MSKKCKKNWKECAFMLRIAICDDERTEIDKIQAFLDELKEYFPDVFYESYFSGESLLAHYKRAPLEEYYDIIYMDIEMGGKDGLATAAEIRKIDKNPILIYVTRFDEHVYDAYDTDPFNYLLKPVSPERFIKVFKNAVKRLKNKDHTYTFFCNYEWVSVYISEILYIESKTSKSNVSKLTMYTTRGNYEYNSTLKQTCKDLEKHNFAKPHGSYLLNMAYIQRLKHDTVVIVSGENIPVSPAYSKTIKRAFIEFSVGRCNL